MLVSIAAGILPGSMTTRPVAALGAPDHRDGPAHRGHDLCLVRQSHRALPEADRRRRRRQRQPGDGTRDCPGRSDRRRAGGAGRCGRGRRLRRPARRRPVGQPTARRAGGGASTPRPRRRIASWPTCVCAPSSAWSSPSASWPSCSGRTARSAWRRPTDSSCCRRPSCSSGPVGVSCARPGEPRATATRPWTRWSPSGRSPPGATPRSSRSGRQVRHGGRSSTRDVLRLEHASSSASSSSGAGWRPAPSVRPPAPSARWSASRPRTARVVVGDRGDRTCRSSRSRSATSSACGRARRCPSTAS